MRMPTTEEFLRATLEQPVALVGNGLLDSLGSVIDSFASIVRFNRFIVSGFEEACGRRTTHWCVRFHVGLEHGPTDLRPFTPYTRDESRERGNRGDIMFARTPMMSRLRRLCPEVLDDRPDVRPGCKIETTGFALTVLLLDNGFRPTLFGFDGLKTGHYFRPTHSHWPGHLKAEREMRYLRSWGVLYAPHRPAYP